jgi:hypothetical protein
MTKELRNYRNPRLLTSIQEQLKIPGQQAEDLFIRTLEFLHDCSVSPWPLTPDDQIDSVWHLFLEQKKEYKKFCAEYLGRFIEHVPKSSGLSKATESLGRCASCQGRRGIIEV